MFHLNNKTSALILLLFYGSSLPLILLNYNIGRAYYDQVNYHFPTIVHFASHFDFSNYPSATSPGYHLIMAAIYNLISSSEVILKLFSSGFTAIFFVLIGNILSKTIDSSFRIAVFLFPAMCSLYIYPSGVWLIPDNLSWLMVASTLYVALEWMNKETKRHDAVIISMLLFVAVAVRQTNIWLMPTIFLCYFLIGFEVDSSEKISQQIRRPQFVLYAQAFFITLPTVLLMMFFIVKWHGLTPPKFQGVHQNINYAVPGFFLAVFFVSAFFYIPYFSPHLHKLLSSKRSVYIIIVSAIFGLLSTLVPHTDFNPQYGRVSGLWNIVKVTPVFEHRSLLLMILSGLGGALISAIFLLLSRHVQIILLASTLFFVAVNMANSQVFERYYFGYVFIFLSLCVMHVNKEQGFKENRLQIIAPIMLSIINSAITIRGLL